MPCPDYEGDGKCFFRPLPYTVPIDHILSICVAMDPAYENCEKRRPTPKPQKLEATCECHGFKLKECPAAHPPFVPEVGYDC